VERSAAVSSPNAVERIDLVIVVLQTTSFQHSIDKPVLTSEVFRRP